MSIFKGDSIYKSGGGSGGGYSDGGALVDSDFIKVENNTISSYDNVSRDPVNFYFEVKDGEILNSVVELTTSVNSTVNVYILDNQTGILIPLNYIVDNTVNADNEYEIIITGNNFSINESIKPAVDPDEVIKIIDGFGYRFIKYGSIYWSDSDFNNVLPGLNYRVYNNHTYYKLADLYSFVFPYGLRLPTNVDVNNLNENFGGYPVSGFSLKSLESWNNETGVTNSSKLAFKGIGYLDPDGTPESTGSNGYWAQRKNGVYDTYGMGLPPTWGLSSNLYMGNSNIYVGVRLVFDA